MAQKKASNAVSKFSGIFEAIGGALSFLPQMFLPAIFGRIREEIDSVLDNFETRMLRLHERMLSSLISRLTSALFIAVGALFIFVGGYFALREYLKLSNTLAFALVGLAMLALGFIIHYQSLRGRQHR